MASKPALRRQLFAKVMTVMSVPPEDQPHACEMIAADWQRCSIDPALPPIVNIKYAHQVAMRTLHKQQGNQPQRDRPLREQLYRLKVTNDAYS
jgi:hypothetical protein